MRVSKFSELTQKGSVLSFSAVGHPAEVHKNSKGAILKSAQVSGLLGKDAAGNYLLDSADAVGGVNLVIDSQLAAEFRDRRKDVSKIKDLTFFHTVLDTDKLSMKRNGTSDTVTVPESFHFTDNRSGPAPKVTMLKDESDLSGSKGSFVFSSLFNVKATDTLVSKLQTGSVEGAVHYHLKETKVIDSAPKPTTSEYDITGDRVDFDFSNPSEGKITLSGHLVWKVQNEFNSSGTCEKIVILTDENRQVTNFDMTGGPPTTNITPPGALH